MGFRSDVICFCKLCIKLILGFSHLRMHYTWSTGMVYDGKNDDDGGGIATYIVNNNTCAIEHMKGI